MGCFLGSLRAKPSLCTLLLWILTTLEKAGKLVEIVSVKVLSYFLTLTKCTVSVFSSKALMPVKYTSGNDKTLKLLN